MYNNYILNVYIHYTIYSFEFCLHHKHYILLIYYTNIQPLQNKNKTKLFI